MSKLPKRIGLAGLALLPIVCCAGLPLLVAAGLSVTAFALIGGITAGLIAVAAVIALLIVRARKRRACAAPAIGNVPRRT